MVSIIIQMDEAYSATDPKRVARKGMRTSAYPVASYAQISLFCCNSGGGRWLADSVDVWAPSDYMYYGLTE